MSVINSAQYTYRKSDFPYTNDLRENTYILLFPSSSLHNLVSFNIWHLHCLDCSISLNLHLVSMLWFKWWDSKILCRGKSSCKSLNIPPSQVQPQPSMEIPRHSHTDTEPRAKPTHMLNIYLPLPFESWTSQRKTWTHKPLGSCRQSHFHHSIQNVHMPSVECSETLQNNAVPPMRDLQAQTFCCKTNEIK